MLAPDFAYSVTSINALSVARTMKPTMTGIAAEALLNDLVGRQWLDYRPRTGSYGLGPRSLLELGPSFRQEFPDERKECFVCHDLVVEGVRCGQEDVEGSGGPECQGFLHTHCSKTYLARRNVCAVCQKPFVLLSVGPEALKSRAGRVNQARNGNGASTSAQVDEASDGFDDGQSDD